MADDRDAIQKGGDLVLTPNEESLVLDSTKGQVNVYVGPYKGSLGESDLLVLYDPKTGKYSPARDRGSAISTWPQAGEGEYIILSNPAAAGVDKMHPTSGINNGVALDYGRTVNIHGPERFPLWPGQSAQIMRGHHLRTNEYLVVEVYNDVAAQENWKSAVMKPQKQTISPTTADVTEGSVSAEVPETVDLQADKQEFTMGQRLIIAGTEVSFYMPPTGVKVIPDENGQYTRRAVTLERLQYCILLAESGEKRYVHGPKVVFPKSTEIFIEDTKGGSGDSRVFRAIELTPLSGIYVKVIADYAEDGRTYKVGDELFITGKDQAIYFPREEHATIKYGDDKLIHYATAVPPGEGRYVMDRLAGTIALRRGPDMLLLNPSREVFVRRVLDEKTVRRLYPGNAEALEYNRRLAAVRTSPADVLTDRDARSVMAMGEMPTVEALVADAGRDRGVSDKGRGFRAGDEITRSTGYTQPRTVTLDTKYDGAVMVMVESGYAVLVIDKSGKRRVEVGPVTLLLEYDETLEAFQLSMGTPKSDERKLDTVYLRVANNRVSDVVVGAETEDLCPVDIRVSYRINFEGDDPLKWFAVEDYVNFVTDHLRSLIRGTVKKFGIENFYANSTAIIRDAVLGVSPVDEQGNATGPRPGRLFAENNMRIYDVEVGPVTIDDADIEKVLGDAQFQAFKQAMDIANKERGLAITKRLEAINRDAAAETSETTMQRLELEATEYDKLTANAAKKAEAAKAAKEAAKEFEAVVQELADLQAASQLARDKAKAEFAQTSEKAENDERLRVIAAETEATVARLGAVSDKLVAALQVAGDKNLLAELSKNLNVQSIVSGEGVREIASKYFDGVKIGAVLDDVSVNLGQGS